MYTHHKETIEKVTKKFKDDKEVLALLLSGSIAHGFERENSDVDIMIIISEKDYQKRRKAGKLTYWENEICTYKEGYIDGKYISIDFMNQVAIKGSEPARFAFEGAVILYANIKGIEELLEKTIKYPIENKEDNIKRFYAQFEAWKWYCNEAIKHNNEYLLNYSVSNFILFSGRLVLAHNEILYPYHKWFLKVLEKAEEKPKEVIDIINNLLIKKDKENIEKLYECIINFKKWNTKDFKWTNQFVIDTELNWMDGKVPVGDI